MATTEQNIPKLSKDLCLRLLADLEKAKRPVLYATKCSLDNARYNHKVGYLTPGPKKVAASSFASRTDRASRMV